jgi:hypothetical protein
MKTKRDRLEETLKNLLTDYLNRDWIKMKSVIRGVLSDLSKNRFISKKQLLSIYTLLNKEKQFIGMSESELSELFAELFSPPPAQSNTLDQFF